MAFPNYKFSRVMGKAIIIMIAVMTMVLFVATDAAVTLKPGRKVLEVDPAYPNDPPTGGYANSGSGAYFVPPTPYGGYP
ncbi:hypothetical protein O6P43_019860 [Quillaja saponaria]|uniref:Uncharacterized protein n=1 Tax=Quillaja saponaria TaxID=32244 RepID=A0AAD7LJS1_QUISA|nr:hypothetical protein O6P43_019860 [Quillaja saponaria]